MFLLYWRNNGALKVSAKPNEISLIKGNSLILNCDTDQNWKFCTWQRNQGEKICKFEYTFNDNAVGNRWKNERIFCDDAFGDPRFTGTDGHVDREDNKQCQIEINPVDYEHSGEYKCKFQRCNPELKGGCKTEIPKDTEIFSDTVTVKVICLLLNTLELNSLPY